MQTREYLRFALVGTRSPRQQPSVPFRLRPTGIGLPSVEHAAIPGAHAQKEATVPRRMYNATIELAERFDTLTEDDLDHRLDQLCGFDPAIGRGERGTAITISLITDGPDEAGEVVRTLIAQRANPNQVDIANSTVTTAEEFDRTNGIEPVLTPPVDCPDPRLRRNPRPWVGRVSGSGQISRIASNTPVRANFSTDWAVIICARSS
ncbi:hypothetical protein [Rhodococcus koreensis]|uniref:hypothetical protein n=1 Tax=Rhodococcus koreensis TaxID=99653 RepID=UPI0036DD3C48